MNDEDGYRLKQDSSGSVGGSGVHGWLMGVHQAMPETVAVGSATAAAATAAAAAAAVVSDKKNARDHHHQRPLSISSISSEDSVNLDELIKANYTLDMDDETDLPDLADLDLDDSDEEFWKMDEAFSDLKLLPNKSPAQLPSRPLAKTTPKSSYPPPTSAAVAANRHRSGSISSENSFTSQSTITPRRIPSESVRATTPITQSRSMTTSTSTLASHDPVSRPGSRLASTPSRLAKRASHIPAPATSRYAPAPQSTTSTRSTSTATGSTPPRPASRLTSRASHIPMTRTKHTSPSSDNYTARAQSPAPPSRLLSSYRSSSIFGTHSSEARPGSSLRPPTASASTSSIRSQSRIGMAKRF